ncbi:hypothetical protein ACHAXR_012692 [Thalassiosira sp. AJA248-18]
MFASQLRCQCHRLNAVESQISRFASSACLKNIPPSVSLELSSSVAILTLRNPKRRNALTVSMMTDFDRHVQTLAKWSRRSDDTYENNGRIDPCDNNLDDKQRSNDARIVILTGANDTFCSGLDLHDNGQNDGAELTKDSDSISVDEHSLKDGNNMIHHMTRVTNQLMSLPVVSISAIDGYAVGGGAELTTCTDLVVLSRSATVQFVHAKRGASFGWGGGRRLVQKVGRGKALRMLLLGECVHGEEEAARAGAGVYADAIGEEGESALEATMRLFVDPILELPCSQSIRAIKNAVSAADGDGEVIDSTNGKLKLDTNMAVTGEMESFMSVWGGDSNRAQIQKAKENLRGPNKS